MDLRFWFALFGPKGLPGAVKAKLESVATKAMADPHVREQAGEPRHQAGFRSSEIRDWTKFIDEKSIMPE